jgi:hypothetical protein
MQAVAQMEVHGDSGLQDRHFDQTRTPMAEGGIEMVLAKHKPDDARRALALISALTASARPKLGAWRHGRAHAGRGADGSAWRFGRSA